MDCPGCHYTNPDDAAFCGECGAPLPRTIECPECGQPAEPAQKFCHSCGTSLRATPAAAGARAPIDYTPQHIAEKILRSKSAVEGERKRLTVLFVDIASSMRLQEERDPEAWHLVMDRFFAILTEGVHRFGGTVNQYTGDGIMGLFGAPIAHEDHAVPAMPRSGCKTDRIDPAVCARDTLVRTATPAGRISRARAVRRRSSRAHRGREGRDCEEAKADRESNDMA